MKNLNNSIKYKEKQEPVEGELIETQIENKNEWVDVFIEIDNKIVYIILEVEFLFWFVWCWMLFCGQGVLNSWYTLPLSSCFHSFPDFILVSKTTIRLTSTWPLFSGRCWLLEFFDRLNCSFPEYQDSYILL